MEKKTRESGVIQVIDDLLIRVLGVGNKGHRNCSAAIHGAFYEMKASADTPSSFKAVLDNISFATDDIYPYSREISGALIRLQIAGYVTIFNPEYNFIQIKADKRRHVSNMLKKLNAEELEAVKRASSVINGQ